MLCGLTFLFNVINKPIALYYESMEGLHRGRKSNQSKSGNKGVIGEKPSLTLFLANYYTEQALVVF
jgi:hypothetical protein